MTIINGTKIRKELLEEYQHIIQEEHLDITLAIIQIGSEEASNIYVQNKMKYVSQVGIKIKLVQLEETVSEKVVLDIIHQLNEDSNITGIILQKPTPNAIDFDTCSQMISPLKDVDGLTKENLLAIRNQKEQIIPCTVAGILKILDYYSIPLEGKKVTIIGRSNLIGRPLADVLLNRNATVFLCHSKTKDLKEITLISDVVISAAGQANLITEDMVKENFIGIDVGMNLIDGKLIGDFSKEVEAKASYLTPVPGGVGPMTVAMVIHNLIKLKNGMK